MNYVPQPKKAGAKSKAARNLQWLAEIESGQATVGQIAEREFLSPGAVRKALKLAKKAKSSCLA